MSIVAYNARLQFQKSEKISDVMQILKWHRDATNAALKTHFGAKRNAITDLHRGFYEPFRKANPDIPSQIVIRAEQECLSNYRSIKSNKVVLKKPPVKKALSLRLDKRSYSVKTVDGKMIISIISSGLRAKVTLQSYPKLDELLNKHRFCDPLIFEKNGELWMSLTFDIPETPVFPKSCVGVDLGKRITAVTSEGKFYQDKKFNAEKRKLRFLKRKLQESGSRSAKKHLHKLRRKERNKNKSQTHALANRILSEAMGQAVVVEDLKGLKVKKNPFENKNSISQVPFYELKKILKYKAPMYGKTVITVNPRYTSQIDHRSGRLEGVRKGRRFIGIDGVILDADHNAAMNIALRSKLPVSDLTASRGLVLDGQAVVTRPNNPFCFISGLSRLNPTIFLKSSVSQGAKDSQGHFASSDV